MCAVIPVLCGGAKAPIQRPSTLAGNVKSFHLTTLSRARRATLGRPAGWRSPDRLGRSTRLVCAGR